MAYHHETLEQTVSGEPTHGKPRAMIQQLNWNGILMGTGAGLISGVVLLLVAGGSDANTGLQTLIQLLSFFIAGLVAARLSLVGAIYAGGFSALILYFGLAVVSVLAGNTLYPVALLLFGMAALLVGSAGAKLVTTLRSR